MIHMLGGLGCLTPSQVVPKFWTHDLLCKPMHVSKWPKRPNLVPGPKLGSNSIFSPSAQFTLSQGVLPTRKPLVKGACAHSTLILFILKGD